MTVYLICYAISYFLARQHVYMLSGLVLITAALWLYWRDYRAGRDLIHLRGLFCLAFVGGQGVSCFKLSRLQTDWAGETWLCFLLAVTAFWLSFELLQRRMAQKQEKAPRGTEGAAACTADAGRILVSMAGITGVSAAAFVFEAVKLGFIPMFSYGVPHAYSYFHVSGVHYFTVSCVLVPSLLVLYLFSRAAEGGIGKRDRGLWLAALLTGISILIPLLCVSRFQLILAVGMAVFTFISVRRTFRLKYLLVLCALMVPAYLALTVLRSHSVAYLNGIFEMKDPHTPIFVTQPYMYIANNYDNFNCLVEQLGAHSMGLRMMFPVWALTGLKFLVPSLVSFPIFVTKEELTTVTLIYDAYYDFGAAGIVLFGFLAGAACALLYRLRARAKNPLCHVIYAQIAMYMALAFFTTWFSNPSTWFYLAVTAAAYWYVGHGLPFFGRSV
ncbi:MAG: oligosaccharide repeat unit polymerase [Enterocloster asparagiformis]|nr:oligosaccharide repeat unit polymerase [Enterocloster asparagiformis]